MAPVAASPGYPGSAGLSDHSPIPAQEEEAERQPYQPEDPEREPESGQRDRHRGPQQRKCVLLSLLALQNGKLYIFNMHVDITVNGSCVYLSHRLIQLTYLH